MRRVSLPMAFISSRAHTYLYGSRRNVFAARWNFPSRANFAYQIIMGNARGYGRTYLRRITSFPSEFPAIIGDDSFRSPRCRGGNGAPPPPKKGENNKRVKCGCLFAIAAFRQPYFPAGVNSAVRHVRQNAFIANGAATTTTTTTTTVTAIVTVVTVIIDVARTELLDRLPPLSRGGLCVRRIRVCPMVRRWLSAVVIRAPDFPQVEIRATDFQPCTTTLKSASANTREIAVKQTLRGIDGDRTCVLSPAFRGES